MYINESISTQLAEKCNTTPANPVQSSTATPFGRYISLLDQKMFKRNKKSHAHLLIVQNPTMGSYYDIKYIDCPL